MRLAALRGLCVVQGEKAVPALATVLKGKDEKTRLVALAFVQDVSGAKATKAIAALVPNLEPPMQAALLGALGTRGDAAARPAVLKAAESTDEAVRVAALKALAGVGGADDALLLAKTAAETQGAVRDAARTSLAILPGEKVDQAMLAALPKAAVPVRLELIGSLAARRTPAAIPVFSKLAEDQEDSLRGEAIKGLEVIGNDSCIDLLVRLVKQPKKDNERDAAERALSAVCSRTTDKDAAAAAVIKAIGGTSGAVKSALLRPLGRIGGEKAVVPVRAALKDTDAGVKDAAVRVISEWPDDAALDDMIGIAKDDPKTTNQVLALRGYVQHSRQRDRSEAERLKMCQAAMPLAKRPDEQKMILGVLRDLRSIEALRLTAPLIGEDNLKREAADAAVRIARNMGDKVPEEAKDAMEQAIQATKDERIQREAREVLQRIERQKKK
ncbi:MAG TPA: HEAT repeat domain-containing protein [Phycisphaerae bacterium]|nr:HEAT repeat domain-containing protein [Phycisphaerae bacterium]